MSKREAIQDYLNGDPSKINAIRKKQKECNDEIKAIYSQYGYAPPSPIKRDRNGKSFSIAFSSDSPLTRSERERVRALRKKLGHTFTLIDFS